MALLKTFETDSGIVGEYWNFSRILIDMTSGEVKVDVQLFKATDEFKDATDD